MGNRTGLGLLIEAGLREPIADQRGEIALETRIAEPITAARVRRVRKVVPKSR
jgi:hypothetical protein